MRFRILLGAPPARQSRMPDGRSLDPRLPVRFTIGRLHGSKDTEPDARAAPADKTAGLDPNLPRAGSAGRSFGRYRELTRLGSGGMATVYKAYDPSLDRTVALKLLLFDDPLLAERLLLEARAQAKVEHENVCPIYEAGLEGDRPYIAMHFVDGVSLGGLRDELTLEQKLKLIKEVAEGVHAAHRVGLVHRDLKPSNVMVERSAEGAWRPFVMDFGLAREVDAPGLTQTGVVMGTPWYMAPEQVRADSRSLDRRTDVYGLGATLYELICGSPPFQADSGIGVLVKVVQEEPVPLGMRNPTVPMDVGSIVMKCLEKEPARRYDSARALAEDIGRYLDGEPTLARPSGVFTRIVKRARKHRAAVATAGLALLLAGASAAYALRARAQARAEARIGAEFARRVQEVEWMLRVAHMAPLHDTRREKVQVRERLEAVRERMREVGDLARGPGEYALGRGQLALGDPETARGHLEAAWRHGYRPPEVAHALGLALGALYERELPLASAIGAPQLREKRMAEIHAAYRDPAVAYLRQSAGGDFSAPEYVEGLLALYEKRYAAALAKADAAAAKVPWLFEARLLRGEVHAVQSRERHETGDAEGSRHSLAAAEAAYGDAAEFARSSPAALEGLCQVGIQRMEATLYQRGALAPLYQATRIACERVVAADGDRAEAHAKLANIQRFWANYLLGEGRDPVAALDLAAGSARRAIELDPRNRRAHGNLGIIHRMRAAHEQGRGGPWQDSLRAAIESLTRAAELSGSDAASLNDLGNAYTTRANAERKAGADPRPDLRRAVEHYDRALEQVPDFGYAHANKGLVLTDVAEYEIEHGLDPAASLQGAVAALERAVALLPDLEGTHTFLAEARALEAEWRISRGEDPTAAVAQARERLAESSRLSPRGVPGRRLTLGRLALAEARHLAAVGRQPGPAIEDARRHLRGALTDDAKDALARQRLREVDELEARWRSTARR